MGEWYMGILFPGVSILIPCHIITEVKHFVVTDRQIENSYLFKLIYIWNKLFLDQVIQFRRYAYRLCVQQTAQTPVTVAEYP